MNHDLTVARPSDNLLISQDSSADTTSRKVPLLKWPGGKRTLVSSIGPLLPQAFGRYFEPFLGGAALFFATQPRQAVLSDNNPELINCYVQVRDAPERVIEYLSEMPNTSETYYRIRASLPTNVAERAARLIFLTTLSFNGIYRTNLRGEFNVPYGRKTHLNPCVPSHIRNVSNVLRTAELICGDFETSVGRATAGDAIYFDPPYTVTHSKNGFVKYNEQIFTWQDQVRLAKAAHRLVDKGCAVIVSNADHPSVADLYRRFRRQIVRRYSVMAAASRFRREITEAIFYAGDGMPC